MFQKSGISDGVKLISDIQRQSINYSETNFEYQFASYTFKRNLPTKINFEPKVLPLQMFSLWCTSRNNLSFPNETSADIYGGSQTF